MHAASAALVALQGFKRPVKIGDDVVDVLCPDGKTDGRRRDSSLAQLLFGKLGMRGACRMNREALHVGDFGEQAEKLQIIDEPPGVLLASANLKREDRRASAGEETAIRLVIGVIGEARVVDALHLRPLHQIRHHGFRVFNMTLHAKAERFRTLQKKEGVERADASTGVSQENGADVGDEGGLARSFRERDAMVARIGLGYGGVRPALAPVERAAVHDDAAERRAVATDEFRGGVNDDVGPVLNGTQQIRRGEGVVHDKGDAVTVRDLRYLVNAGNVGIRIPERFKVNGLGVVANGRLDRFEVVRVDEGGFDTEVGKRMREQIVRAAVNGFLRYDMPSRLGKRLDGVGDGRRPRRHGQRGASPFKRGDAPLERVLRGVGKTAVDVPSVRQIETSGSMLAIVENVRSGLVDRDRSRAGGRVGLLLPYVELKRFKTIVIARRDRHDDSFRVPFAWHRVRMRSKGSRARKRRPSGVSVRNNYRLPRESAREYGIRPQ